MTSATQTTDQIRQLLADASREIDPDSKAFQLLQIAVTGHMDKETQARFLQDVTNRGLVVAPSSGLEPSM